LAEPEVRLEMRCIAGEIHPLLDQVARRLNSRKISVTRGKRGAIVRSATGESVDVPAFVFNAVDRVGAGDAYLSVTAPAAFLDAPDEVIGLIGNALGSMAVEIIGNQRAVELLALKKHITSILK
ncbi:MAG: cytidyltransferase, partial [Magnetococcales bacterium]|nr:cytidyltransferase [Magnetococcales bacterium]